MMRNSFFRCGAWAAVALASAGLALAEGGPAAGDDIEALLAGMSTRDRLAQMMVPAFRTWKGEDGTAVPIRGLNGEVRDSLRRNRYGGVLLFGENCAEAVQTLRLVAEMQEANREGGGVPLLVAADQEGGGVARLAFGTYGPGAMALAATGDAGIVRGMARIHGEELGLLGINTDFAPVADVNDNAANPVIGVRSFGDDARAAGECVRAFVEGLHEAGTIATLKHFPGHGNTDTDSHTGLPTVGRTLAELETNELVPFRAGIAAGADMVMTAHIQFPAVEGRTCRSIATGKQIPIPATLSKTILSGILRERLGFEGVIVSDAIEMKAIQDNYATDDVLSMAVNAGVNLLLLPSVCDAEGLAKTEALLDRAVELAENGTIDAARVEDSVRRILALKRKYGLLAGRAGAGNGAAAAAGCGSGEHLRFAREAAQKALTLLKNENGAFPVALREGGKTLVLFTDASRAGALDAVRPSLGAAGGGVEGMAIGRENAEACIEAAKEADHVVVVSRAWNAASLDPSTEAGFPVGVVRRITAERHAAGGSVVVVSAQLPYDAACHPDADAVLLAYGSAAGGGENAMPNLPAALRAVFGLVEPGGTLPVDVPELDGKGRPTGKILHPRGSGLRGGGAGGI